MGLIYVSEIMPSNGVGMEYFLKFAQASEIFWEFIFFEYKCAAYNHFEAALTIFLAGQC